MIYIFIFLQKTWNLWGNVVSINELRVTFWGLVSSVTGPRTLFDTGDICPGLHQHLLPANSLDTPLYGSMTTDPFTHLIFQKEIRDRQSPGNLCAKCLHLLSHHDLRTIDGNISDTCVTSDFMFLGLPPRSRNHYRVILCYSPLPD